MAVNEFDGARRYPLPDIGEALDLAPSTPLTMCDARDQSSSAKALILLVEHLTSRPEPLCVTAQTADALDPTSRVPMYTPEFAADPHRVYEQMRRQYGSLVPVLLDPDVPATLVIGYRAALGILHDQERFPADPRRWQEGVPDACPVKPMMEWRPNALRSSGVEHARYRGANVYSLNGVDLHGLRTVVQDVAVDLINEFCQADKAELISQYAFPLAFQVLNRLLGCPPEIGGRVALGMAQNSRASTPRPATRCSARRWSNWSRSSARAPRTTSRRVCCSMNPAWTRRRWCTSSSRSTGPGSSPSRT